MIDEDNDISVLAHYKYLEDAIKRDMKKTASEFEDMGDMFINEIEVKKKIKNKKSQKLIPYILKKSGDIYDKDELNSYSFEDIQNIYDETKKKNQPVIVKFFNFIFNFE